MENICNSKDKMLKDSCEFRNERFPKIRKKKKIQSIKSVNVKEIKLNLKNSPEKINDINIRKHQHSKKKNNTVIINAPLKRKNSKKDISKIGNNNKYNKNKEKNNKNNENNHYNNSKIKNKNQNNNNIYNINNDRNNNFEKFNLNQINLNINVYNNKNNNNIKKNEKKTIIDKINRTNLEIFNDKKIQKNKGKNNKYLIYKKKIDKKYNYKEKKIK